MQNEWQEIIANLKSTLILVAGREILIRHSKSGDTSVLQETEVKILSKSLRCGSQLLMNFSSMLQELGCLKILNQVKILMPFGNSMGEI